MGMLLLSNASTWQVGLVTLGLWLLSWDKQEGDSKQEGRRDLMVLELEAGPIHQLWVMLLQV